MTYHVLLPIEDSATVESGMGALAGGEVLAATIVSWIPRRSTRSGANCSAARTAVRDSVANIQKAGGKAVGDIVSVDPIQAQGGRRSTRVGGDHPDPTARGA